MLTGAFSLALRRIFECSPLASAIGRRLAPTGRIGAFYSSRPPSPNSSRFLMAKVEFENAIAGFRGKLGPLIYRKQHGQTVVLPAFTTKKKWTAAQRTTHARFREAQAYAAQVLADPLKRERYRQLA